MSILESIRNLANAHSSFLGYVENVTIHEALHIISSMYPNNPALIALVQKIADEIMKLQNITPNGE